MAVASPRQHQLDQYKKKRDFRETAEPAGKIANRKNQKLTYIIQKHAASHLHFDFRLEWNGVLKSWAVAKGPSRDPGQKRLAVQVEDHPVEYATFEGTIPKGQYGGGTVMLWDRGTWEALDDDVDQALQKGRLSFRLHGERLSGEWHLVRMGGKAAGGRRQNWLLIKAHDNYSDDSEADYVTGNFITSIKTGRTMEEIADGKSKAAAQGIIKKDKKQVKPKTRKTSTKEKLPDFVAPQLATLVEAPPQGSNWIHEVKFDGYRALVRIEGRDIRMLTRANNDWTHRFQDLPELFKSLKVRSALIDGEVVTPLENGATSFHALQLAMGKEGAKAGLLHYYAFDLLYLNGKNLMQRPLRERKEKLRDIMPENIQRLHFSADFSAPGKEVFEKACDLKLEGIISKRADAPYVSGRGKEWVKTKCVNEQEMVIGGFTCQPKHPGRLGALLIGYYKDNKFIFAGKVGTGFTQKEGRQLLDRLEKLVVAKTPFASVPASYRRAAQWVEPVLVMQAAFTEWTKDGMLRHPAYNGLREDKPAKQVVREVEKEIKPENSSPELMIKNVPVSHPEKILYADAGITKKQVAEYYARVGEMMLPYVKGFPLSLVRCPEGEGKNCFFQRHSDIDSAYLKKAPVELEGKISDFMAIDRAEGLIVLAQMGVLEIHTWNAKAKTPDKPEQIVFDFDPDENVDFQKVKDAALDMRRRLEKLGMKSFLKTTGGKGLHVVVPFQKGPDWDAVRAFAEAMASLMAEDHPALYTINSRKAAREGKIYIDYLRNTKAASAIAPFSTRAKPGAPIAMPLSWNELKRLKKPDHYTLKNLPKILKDPWRESAAFKQKLKIRL